jgi:hypothetical protein
MFMFFKDSIHTSKIFADKDIWPSYHMRPSHADTAGASTDLTAGPRSPLKSVVRRYPNPLVRFSSTWVIRLGLVVLTALTLRVLCIDRQSFNYDESVTEHLRESRYAEQWSGAARDNGNPPLYWSVARARPVFSANPN